MWNSFAKVDDDFNKYKFNFPKSKEHKGYVAPYGETPLDNEITGQNIYLNIIRCLYKNDLEYLKYLELIKQGKTISKRDVMYTLKLADNIYYEVEGAKKYLETFKNSSGKIRYQVVDTAPAAGFVLDTEYNAIKSRGSIIRIRNDTSTCQVHTK